MDSVEQCNICYEDEANCSLNCDHKVCKSCYNEINLCPFCRRSILRLDKILNRYLSNLRKYNELHISFNNCYIMSSR